MRRHLRGVCLGLFALVMVGCDRTPQPGTDAGHAIAIAEVPSVAELLPALHARRFDAADRLLTGYQAAFEHDLAREETVHLGFASFATADAQDGALLDEWIRRSPGSFAAHLALAYYLFHQGWITRGEGGGGSVSDASALRMTTFFDRGRGEVEAALRINPRLTVAYSLLIYAARTDADLDGIAAIAQRGIKEVPASFIVRVAYMQALLPRWGGSYEAMEKFAAEAQKYATQNPRLRVLLGMVDWDKGDGVIRQDPSAALSLCDRAIAHGDYYRFYAGRGDANYWLKNYEAALRDLTRAIELFPSGMNGYADRAWTQARLGHPAEVLSDIQTYRQYGYPDSSLLALKNWALEVESHQIAATAKLPGDPADD
jgi:tetratricopeptide (TPR) repeat protein